MALIVLTSANGSPGVTTSALGLALVWPRPTVLVDADPTGSLAIPAGYFRGGQLPTDQTIVDLALSHRQGTLVDDLPSMLVPIPDSQVQFLCGPRRHNQARSLENLWEPLAVALKALERNGQDVIVDAGRLGLEGSPTRLVASADLALLTTRSTLPALVAAASWSQSLRESFARAGAEPNLGALLIGQGMPYGAKETAKTLQLPVISTLAWDRASAEVLALGARAPRRYEQSNLSRSLRACVQTIQATITTSRESLGLVPSGRTQ